MSALTTLPRVAKAGFTSFIRNGWLSVAATGIVTFALVLVSIFAMLMLLGNDVVKTIQNKIDVEVYFKDEAKTQDILTLKQQLETNPNTASVTYISKEQALEIFKGRSEKSKNLADEAITEENNPLPPSLQIKAKDTNNLESFNPTLESDFAGPMIAERSDKENRAIIQNLQRIVGFIRSIGLFISLVVLVFAVLVVFNTIRITIFSRREEIEIMRLVGASNWYIRGPFVMEGIAYGVIATLVALGVVYLVVLAFGPAVTSYLRDINEDIGSYFLDNLLAIVSIQLLTGIGVGIISSMIAIRRHLRV